MTFRDKIIADLGRYKKNVLCISEPGIYKYRGKEYKKDHILPAGGLNRLNRDSVLLFMRRDISQT